MKAAILGTTDYHATMQQIAQNALQPKLFYITEIDVRTAELPPVEKRFAKHADIIVQAFTRNNKLIDCNPRLPYLFLAWMLVGAGNDYRLTQYVNYQRLQKQIAIFNLKIALDDDILIGELDSARTKVILYETTQPIYRIVDVACCAAKGRYGMELVAHYAINSTASWVARVIHGFASKSRFGIPSVDSSKFLAVNETREQIQRYFACKMNEWAYITDEEAGLIARLLLFDILDAGR